MKIVKIVAVNLAVLLAFLAICEAVGQFVAARNPSYQVLFLEPDSVTGWKHVPDFSYEWTGHYWYAADFSVPVRSNRLGFRDRRYVESKPPGVTRVALFGNSFIEALQVEDEKTADFLLERQLNASTRSGAAPSRSWEVLNFAISNYGVGQYFLTWQEYTRRYSPDYVAVFVAYFHMKRTVRKYTSGAFRYSRERQLWVRPVFKIDERDSLVMVPAADYAQFDSLQQDVIRNEFGGSRVRLRRSLVTLEYLEQLTNRVLDVTEALVHDQEVPDDPHEYAIVEDGDTLTMDKILEINMRVLGEMGSQVKSTGAQMIIMDASKYFADEDVISDSLKALSARHGFGYVPVYEPLLEAEANGHDTRWRHDGHFNELGNQIVANTMYDWLARQERPSRRDSVTTTLVKVHRDPL